MKILGLRFKNLNSLYGEWFIDFTTSEYVSNGIFALTGPTGAGKSTVLDAICLALYGATPRLGKITKSGNEIMSRQTGECYAEVTFESQAGTFRCHWSQHRARKKAEGNLADSRHEIADGLSGQILESKKRDVAGVIEEKTGMDFERFTRSILLAQGGFDTFLKANAEQKSKTLEQITGTEIYTEISTRVHERQRDERQKLNLLQAETSGITVLSEEQETELNRVLAKKQQSETDTAARFQRTEKAMAWILGINGLRSEMTSLAKQGEKLDVTLETFKPERERLCRAQKAAEIEADYATLTAVRKQQNLDQKALKAEETQFPETEASVSQKEEWLISTEQLTVKAKEEQKSLAPLIQKVRTLEQLISVRKKWIDAGDIDCRTVTEQLAGDKTLLEQTRSKLEIAQKDVVRVEDYLKVNAHDESLVTQLAGIEEQLSNLMSVQQHISEKKISLAETEKQWASASKTLNIHTGKLTSLKQELDNNKQKMSLKKTELSDLTGDRLLREYRTEKETLLREMAFLRKISDLESERNKLEDGKPCPLCGSAEHPYAEGNVPAVDETEKNINTLTELIQQAEQLELSINKLEAAEKNTSAKVTTTEKLEAEAANEKKNTEKALSDITGELTRNNDRFEKLKRAALTRLQPVGIQEIPEADVSALLSSLKIRLRNWQEQQQKKEEIELQSSNLNSELKRLHAIFETQSQSLAEKQNALSMLKKEYDGQTTERNDLFANKNPDAEEARLEKAVAATEQAEKTVRSERDNATQLLNSAKVRIASLQLRISKRVTELQISETDFISTLSTAGFAEEQSFIASRLSVTERALLVARAKQLDDKKTDIQLRKKDRESRLAQEINKKMTESKLEELEPVHKELEESLTQLRDDLAGLKHKLTENHTAREKIREKQGLIDAQKNECCRWEKLHGLIGSADGKKYRNFAQGLTFELMVSHANRQLEKMTDRYLLIRDDEEPLELNVIDNYQAGEVRSTKNLSGGESFIVSLTLALGLSKMASRKVRVDSLFLDEGFGTLDEEALETALETLAGLQQDGKLIGIISHVSALKERISTQINIFPISAGKSAVTGPGCSKVTSENS